MPVVTTEQKQGRPWRAWLWIPLGLLAPPLVFVVGLLVWLPFRPILVVPGTTEFYAVGADKVRGPLPPRGCSFGPVASGGYVRLIRVGPVSYYLYSPR